MSLKLITNAGDYRSFKAFIAAKYAGVNIEYDEEFVGTTEKAQVIFYWISHFASLQ